MTTIGDFLIGLMMVSAIIIGGGMFLVDVANQYDVPPNRTSAEYFENTFNILNDTYDITEGMSETMEEQRGVASAVQSSAVLFWGAAKILLNVPNLFYSLFFESMALAGLGIPPWFQSLIVFSVTITITLLIMSALFKWRFK